MKKLITVAALSLAALTVQAKDIVDTAVAAGSFKTLATALQAKGVPFAVVYGPERDPASVNETRVVIERDRGGDGLIANIRSVARARGITTIDCAHEDETTHNAHTSRRSATCGTWKARAVSTVTTRKRCGRSTSAG